MMKKLILALGLVVAAAPTAMAQYYDDDYRPRRYAPYRYEPPPPPIYREREDYRPYRPQYSRGWGRVCAAVKNTNCVLPRSQPIGSGCSCVTGSGANREGSIVR